MRLLDVDSFTLQEFSGSDGRPPYAILSHTWGDDEVTFQDVQNLAVAQAKPAFDKIRNTCEQAKADGFQFAWVDTCCIDKLSSHELSEAINSMYRWYEGAAVCYVYLSDVPGSCPPLGADGFVHPVAFRYIEAFEESRWFTRGWTLQELIAPPRVEFFGQAWNFIGALEDMLQRVSGITGIQVDVLDHSRPPGDVCVARRLSWAAHRKTKRIEDRAYAMLGILDVNMSLLYGEGEKSFLRLQEEIIRQSTDQTIFAWDAPIGFITAREVLLAPSPECFANCRSMRRRRATATESAFRMSNKGLEITLPILRRRVSEDPSVPSVTLGILDCKHEGSSDILALVMGQHPSNQKSRSDAMELYVSGFDHTLPAGTSRYARLLELSPRDLALPSAKPTLLTITRDLQSLTYIRTFSSNKASWFPITFVADPSSIARAPCEHAFYPESAWYETSRTMRLQENNHGGLVVDTRDGRHILIAFGLRDHAQAKEIYGMCYIDPMCVLQSHVEYLVRRVKGEGGEAAGLTLAATPPSGPSGFASTVRESLVARMWRGALRIAKETTTAETTDGWPIQSLLSPLSPPASPLVRSHSASATLPLHIDRRRKGSDHLLSPSSPRSPSFSRRDSLLVPSQTEKPALSSSSGGSSDHSRSNSSSTQPNHYSSSHFLKIEPSRIRTCDHCRLVRAGQDDLARKLAWEKQDRADKREVQRLKVERNKKLLTTAKKAGVGLSIGSMVADLAVGADWADVVSFL